MQGNMKTLMESLPPEAQREFRRIMLGDTSDIPEWMAEILHMIGIETPAEAEARIARAVEERGLTDNVRQLREQGYTILRGAFDADKAARIREGVLAAAEEDVRDGIREKVEGGLGQTVFRLVERGRVFEEAVLDPKLTPVLESMLGTGYCVATFTGMIRPQGTAPLPLHSDNQFMPAPFPSWSQGLTGVWYTEDTTAEDGASRVVPGSHKRCRHPRPGEGEDEAIPLEAPAGSIAVWVSNTWHGNCGRKTPGKRVTLHTAFLRLHNRPIESYDDMDPEILARNPPDFARLLGHDLPYDCDRSGPGPLKMLKTTFLAQTSGTK